MIWEHIKPILTRKHIATTSLSHNLLLDDNTILPHLCENLDTHEVLDILKELDVEIYPENKENSTHVEYINDDFVILKNTKASEIVAYTTNPFSSINKFNIQSKYPSVRTIGYISSANSIFTKNKSNTKQIVDNDDLLYTIIERAINLTASDIHISVRNKKNIAIKFRVFGEIIESSIDDINIDNYESFANNVINTSGGNGGEFNKYYEGQFDYQEHNINISLRLQQNPSIHQFKNGKYIPNFVMRLHDHNKKTTFKNIDEVGFIREQVQSLKSLAQHNSGLIIISGPTGSGKTTALYSILNETIKNRARVVQTIEDPVEIIIPGINQTNINKELGIDYENAINKSILRSDTDVALIGEIRSSETAKGVVELKRTGHLVLSTIHTDSTTEIIARLHEFGISFSDIADNLSAMISTRLVKKVCPHCSDTVLISDLQKFQNIDFDSLNSDDQDTKKQNKARLRQLKVDKNSKYIGDHGIGLSDRLALINKSGCKQCHGGYSGRMLVAETVVIDNSIKEMIRKNSSLEIMKHIQRHGNLTIWQHGLRLVKEGKTTIDALESVLPAHSAYGDNYSIDESNRV
jgi:type IV pilus assembly protein PilB